MSGENNGRPHPGVRVLIADDHELMLDMLQALLKPEFEVVGTVSNGHALVRLAQQLEPDIVLVDVIMPGLGGLDAGRALRLSGNGAKQVYLTMATDTAIAVEAFALGASAYLSKSSSATELCRVLHLVAAGGRYLDPAIANSIGALHASHSADPIVRLTPRELEVLKMLVTGMSMKAAARNLGITPRTVAFHKYRAMDILGLNGNSELIDFAVCHGLLNGRTGRFVGR